MTADDRALQPSATTARARALVAKRMPDAVALGRAAGDIAPDPAAAVEILRPRPRRPRRPRVPRGPAAHRPRHRNGPGRPRSVAARREPGTPRLDAPRSQLGAPRPRRADARAAAPRVPLARLRPPRALNRSGPGANLAAGPCRGQRGRRLDHGGLARPCRRAAASSAEPYRWAELEQLVYSPSRWERRLVGSTVATIPFIDRTTGRTAGRRTPRSRPRGRACRRRRARRAEGALMGAAHPGAGGPRPPRSRSCGPRPRAPPRPPTATAPGSSATPSASCPRPSPPSWAPASRASGSAPAPHRHPAPRRPPPTSWASASASRPPSAPSSPDPDHPNSPDPTDRRSTTT